MLRLLLKWLLYALALLITAHLVPGFHLRSMAAALIAVLIIGFLNMTLGLLLKIVTFPLTILTFGLFLLVINAFILKLAGNVVPGFYVSTWSAAFIGAVVLALLNLLLRLLLDRDDR
ncbi:MAG TPA: phage holin family protein [Acidobacteriaceae bacterium]|jgi:putative membrane protein|nr:phage holin family protein [Acidobacteriaceae bacterium]